ncbi:hypothetical protein H4R24_002743 [Coemansia sp. RSA 988]|nr:hypothetical protein H4R24_002743 [Coemansia sp. RSA 988]
MYATHIYTAQLFGDHAATPWKLQMSAISSHQQLLFVALHKNVEIYRIGHHTQPPTFEVRLKDPALELNDDEINALSLGNIHGSEVLVVVYDSGRTVVWGVCDGFRVLWETQRDSSTWGCAVSDASGMVATSANSHTIDILQHRDQLKNETTYKGTSPQESHGANNGVHQLQRSCQTLHGHTSNIPCVAFSATGQYLASASIDRTVRVWSMEHMKCMFIFRYIQWCWSVAFVYPFYFLPTVSGVSGSRTPERSGVSIAEAQRSYSGGTFSSNGEQSYDTYDEGQSGSEGDGDNIASLENRQNNELQDTLDTPIEVDLDYVAEHSQDMLNGYVDSNTSPAVMGSPEGSANSPGGSELADLPFVPEDSQPAYSSPLLLCSTRCDLLLLDPSNDLLPVVDKIARVVARTSRPAHAEALAFDRITFLEWIPELGIAIAGAFSGTVAIVRLSTSFEDGDHYHQMHVLARIPEQPYDSQLYGVSVYQCPEEDTRSSTFVLYLLFLDGGLMVYELHHPHTLADSD